MDSGRTHTDGTGTEPTGADGTGGFGGFGPGTRLALERAAHREEYARLIAVLTATTRDVSLSEEALGDAFERALRTWPRAGVPRRPEAWLVTVARNRARDIVTSAEARRTEALVEGRSIAAEERDDRDHGAIPDKRLELLFACAHPAVAPAIRTPLMMQVVLGLEAGDVARAFGLPPTTLAQRLVRAKRRIRDSGIPFRIPGRDQMPDRLPSVLEAIYGAYAVDWLDQGERIHTSLADESRWLAELTAGLLDTEPEAWGLAALLTFAQARAPARTGDPRPPVHRQNTDLWDRGLIGRGEEYLRRAHRIGAPLGRFQLEAAIQSAHCDRARTGTLDRRTVLRLYDGLIALAPTSGALAARAALAESDPIRER